MKDKNRDKKDIQGDGAVDSYLYDGDWVEEDGVKWAFFSDDADEAIGLEKKGSLQFKGEGDKLGKKERDDDKLLSQKVSITDIGRAAGGKRYSSEASIPSSGDLEKGTFLSGRYKILELYKSLEKRDFYMAKDIRLDSPCIIKELIVDSDDREEVEYSRKRFSEEAKILADLSHPNLPVVTDYFVENNRYFMVIDYIKGFDLETIISNKKAELSEEQILLWGIDICDVLEYLHSQVPPVIHRDICPANFFIRDRDWAVILFNFTFARRHAVKCTGHIGTAGYAAPEQMAGKPVIQSDIYSLGAALHHLLTGEKPERAFDFKPVSVFNPSVSIYTDMALKKALKVNIKERFNNAEEMKEALLEAYDKLENNETWPGLSMKKDPFEELSFMLEEKSKRLRAIKALGELGDIRALELLLPLLEEKSPAVRLSTIGALETLRERKAVPHLIKLMEDENIEIRTKSIKAIEKITGKKMPPLMVVPRDTDLFSF